MNTNHSVGTKERGTWMPIHKNRRRAGAAPPDSRAARAESLQRRGKRMVVAGFVVTIACVVVYCAVTFAGGMSADMGDILFRNAAPAARATLAVLGLGTLVWLVGSFTYLRGALDADEDPDEEAGKPIP